MIVVKYKTINREARINSCLIFVLPLANTIVLDVCPMGLTMPREVHIPTGMMTYKRDTPLTGPGEG